MNKPNHCWRWEEICTQQCSRCRVAYYCSKECQKQDKWRATYYWGNIPAVNLLNLSMNEGREYSSSLALLLCIVGEPRNVLLTIASLPEVYTQQVSFVLNDICPCTLARTVLLLYMLNKGMFNYQDTSCLGYTVNDRLSAAALIQFFRLIFCYRCGAYFNYG